MLWRLTLKQYVDILSLIVYSFAILYNVYGSIIIIRVSVFDAMWWAVVTMSTVSNNPQSFNSVIRSKFQLKTFPSWIMMMRSLTDFKIPRRPI